MKTLDYLNLDPKSLETTIEGLHKLLANIQVYYTNLRGFHWNVKGDKFYELHEKFEEFYDDLNEQADEVAERLLMLGSTPTHKYSDYLKVSTIKETGIVSDAKEIIEHILNSIKVLIGLEREILQSASEAGDEGTVSLISDMISGQEKDVWMLTAYLS